MKTPFRMPGSTPSDPPTIETLRRLEIDLIRGGGGPDHNHNARPTLWGLALSGGGIRSATFALGLLQSLAQRNALKGFHYLSTVSGGGYAGAFLQGAIHRFGLDDALALLKARAVDDARVGRDKNSPQAAESLAQNRPLRHLREYSNYLSPNKSLVSGDTLGMIATYLRNVLLTQTQLLALMLALGVMPLLLYPWLKSLAAQPGQTLFLATLCAVLSASLVAFLSHRAQHASLATRNAAPSFVHTVVSLVLVSALAGGAALAALAITQLPIEGADARGCLRAGYDDASPACAGLRLGLRTAGIYFSVWLLWLLFDALLCWLRERTTALRSHWLRFLAGSVLAAGLAGLALLLMHSLAALPLPDRVWTALTVGAFVVFVLVAGVAAMHVGLVGRALNELQRELWARIGGRAGGLVVLGFGASLGLLIYGPWALLHVIVERENWVTRMAGWGSVLSWLGVTLSGVFSAARVGQSEAQTAPKRNALRRAIAAIAPWVFVLGLWVAIGLLVQVLLGLFGAGAVPALEHAGSLRDYLAAMSTLASEARGSVWALFGVAAAAWLVLGFATDANELSLNAFYRNRLVRCYLGATHAGRQPEPLTNFDLADDITLADLVPAAPDTARSDASAAPKPDAATRDRTRPQRPLYPLIGAAMNLVSAKQLDWQDRRAASFVFTPRYCGHLPPPGRADAVTAGDRAADDRELGLARGLSLGTAVAISGAAVSPNMGARSSPAITFLLTLFDARLGWWVPNRVAQSPVYSDHPGFPGMQLLAELLGLTNGCGRFAHISDGGHFENLALYELVRRNCRFILCSDAGADPQREFADLGNAILKCRVDFGAEIDIDIDELRPDPSTGLSRRHATLGKIRYANGEVGMLLYIKPSLLGDEPADVEHYARQHPEFPHQPTADQYFDEAQFECYRKLGEHIGERVVGEAMSRIENGCTTIQLGLDNDEVKEQLLAELSHRFYSPVDAIARHFSRHSEVMARLFATLRSQPGLRTLDTQIYPGWANAQPAQPPALDAQRSLPPPQNFRECFYFCQELMQFMESVYIDLDLDANHNHPDNRGWMNTFRHWSWAPIFRVAWALSAQGYGARFVAFCETRVGIPRITSALKLVEHSVDADATLADLACKLEKTGEINFLERSILSCSAMRDGPRADAVILLQLRWGEMVDVPAGQLRDLTLGIAVVADGMLRLFRVQDHVRRLGLGNEFMRQLIAERSIDGVEIAAGTYGAAGGLREAESRRLRTQLEDMRQNALLRRQAATRTARGGPHASG